MIFYILLIIFILVILGVPIVFSFGFGSLIYCLLVNINTFIIPQRIFASLDNFTFLAIPFFLLVGNLANIGGITSRLLNLARRLVGYFKGGLGYANVVASMLFAGLSGSAVADAAGLGIVEMKMMRESGYDDEFSAAITLASSIIGPIIPPSIIMVLYGMVATVSIGRMLAAGILPGILIGVSLMVMVYFISQKRNYPADKWMGFKAIFLSIKDAFLPLLSPLIILMGILFGIFTPTEAGAVAALYTLIIGAFVYKEIKWEDLKNALLDTAVTTSLIGFILGVSGVFSWIITIEGVPHYIVDLITSLTQNKIVIVLLINAVILVLGCFIDSSPLIILIVPVLLPLLEVLEMNLVHFGIMICINCMLGTITPPVGTCLFAVSSISGLPVDKLFRAVLPFFLMLIISLLIVTFVPQVSLVIPNMIFGEEAKAFIYSR